MRRTARARPLNTSVLATVPNQQAHYDRNDCENQAAYLPGAVWTLALDISGSGIDHHVIDLALKLVSSDPHRQQQVQEEDP